jgi:hypothetical protein
MRMHTGINFDTVFKGERMNNIQLCANECLSIVENSDQYAIIDVTTLTNSISKRDRIKLLDYIRATTDIECYKVGNTNYIALLKPGKTKQPK